MPTSTYIDPSAVMMNGCMGWSPPSGNPETTVIGGALGTMEPRRQRIAHDAIVDLRVNRALIERDARAAGSAGLDGFAEALDHVGLSRAGLILQGHQKPPACGVSLP